MAVCTQGLRAHCFHSERAWRGCLPGQPQENLDEDSNELPWTSHMLLHFCCWGKRTLWPLREGTGQRKLLWILPSLPVPFSVNAPILHTLHLAANLRSEYYFILKPRNPANIRTQGDLGITHTTTHRGGIAGRSLTVSPHCCMGGGGRWQEVAHGRKQPKLQGSLQQHRY